VAGTTNLGEGGCAHGAGPKRPLTELVEFILYLSPQHFFGQLGDVLDWHTQRKRN